MSETKHQPDKPRRASQPAEVEQFCSVIAAIASRLTKADRAKGPRQERKRGD